MLRNFGKKNDSMNPDFLKITLNLVGGVVVFLYGMHLITETLKKMAGGKLKDVLAKYTTHTLSSICVGIAITAIMGSSSLVIILTIALVNAKILNLRQSLGIVMGSNIGTTIVTQIIAFKLSDYASLILLGGFIWLNMSKKIVQQHTATILICVGLIFFGLEFMDMSVAPLRNYKPFTDMMLRLENPIVGVLMGGLFTLIIQASSATVAIAISLASQNLIGLPAGIALMMGAEIGTCSDTLLATIGRSRQAIRTGVFHLFFNIFSVLLGIALIQPFTSFILWISGDASVGRKIANAHLFFNIGGVLLFAGFTPYFVKLLEWLIPDKRTQQEETLKVV